MDNILIILILIILLGWNTLGHTQTTSTKDGTLFSWLFDQNASFSESIATDRPTFSLGAGTVPKKHVQFETGYTFSVDGARPNTTTHTFPETLIRIGLTDTFEMRLEWPTQTFINSDTKQSGLEDLALGFKTQIFQQQKWMPQFSIAGRLSIPTGNRKLSSNHVDTELQTIWSYVLNERFSLFGNVNIGSAGSQNKRFAQFSSSLGLGVNLGNSLSGFMEYFGFYPVQADSRNLHSLQTGLIYQITYNLQLDARVGAGLNHNADDLFTGAGLSWRF
ncbi:Putative MetA-pathway of phenol degradation [Nitrosomonas sp. Nm51]|uniref:transporter n=1 Tax=Nitrosomonas sp. Nm51 TaxID=133720 RepID=UPI0008C397AE|nr:transporter [Nitrosomonas sp. Nm51]SER81176.1 Putative MetA-pathway of phenol degradation [Nitrosomonas sp. Nm51]